MLANSTFFLPHTPSIVSLLVLQPPWPSFVPVSLPIDATTQYPTSLTHTASASWSQTTADPHGIIHVSHPSVPWDQIRATQGWAGLQHVNVLRGWLSVRPPSDLGDASESLLRTELLQGAFFTVLPPPDSPQRKTHVPEWHYGNIYALERPPVQLLRLPVSPARNEEARYEVIICAPYEVHRSLSSPYSTRLISVDTPFWRPLCILLPASSSNTQFLRLPSVPMLHDAFARDRRNPTPRRGRTT